MRTYDLIEKKKHGGELTDTELDFFVHGVTDGSIPDYQISALLMAIYFKGMTQEETAKLTMHMAKSGDMIDLSAIKGYKVDKHSTGGVGDKTSLVIVPTVAALGVKVAKMSGRGLGFTGGTIDKLESIPGFNTAIPKDEFFKIVNETGAAIVGQTGNLAPADKKLYALRDVTATVDSIPLIAASIMSKKLASGANGIVLDVKIGSGAFCKTLDQALLLGKTMVSIGTHLNRDVIAIITDMAKPLGSAIGNSIEVAEAVEVLKGRGPADLQEICLTLCANMVYLAKNQPLDVCIKEVEESIKSGAAFESFCKMVKAQGGDTSFIENTELFPKAKYTASICAPLSGYIQHMDTEAIGTTSSLLGAGRETKESQIDYSAGIYIFSKQGDFVKQGDVLAKILTNDKNSLSSAGEKYLSALSFSQSPSPAEKLIRGKITKDNLEIF
ncbi:MAG: pyrimidine-nucleoside phosphorylase [Oscillospiraceae bacterium]